MTETQRLVAYRGEYNGFHCAECAEERFGWRLNDSEWAPIWARFDDEWGCVDARGIAGEECWTCGKVPIPEMTPEEVEQTERMAWALTNEMSRRSSW